ncbi:MAG: hypothetical protein QM727_07995 [Niabella sp.]
MLMVYGFASFGISLNYFYCCGNLKTVSLSVASQQEQDNCPMKGKKGCCEHKTVSHKISVDQNANAALFLASLHCGPAALPAPPYLAKANVLYAQFHTPTYKKPPPLSQNNNLVFLSVFRI